MINIKDHKTLRLARRRAHEKTPEFQEVYRFRAGIEGTMSQMDRKTGLKCLRVRGLAAVSFCATLKAVGINILRAVAFKSSENEENPAQNQGNFGLDSFGSQILIKLAA